MRHKKTITVTLALIFVCVMYLAIYGIRHACGTAFAPAPPTPRSQGTDASAELDRLIDEASAHCTSRSNDAILLPGSAGEATSQRMRDEEWSRLPRTTHSVMELLAKVPRAVKARRLLRSHELNPRDAYIPQPAQRELEAIVDFYRGLLAKAHVIIAEERYKEVDLLIQAGKLTPFEMTADQAARGEQVARRMQAKVDQNPGKVSGLAPAEVDPRQAAAMLAMRTQGFDGLRRSGDGKYYMFATRDLPRSRELQDATHMRWIEMEYAGAIAGWAIRNQLITGSQGAELVQQFWALRTGTKR